jgi:putative transcriptional regulator
MTTSDEHSTYLDGKMLIAMPNIGDPRFDRTVIYLWHHSEDGAMGIVVNKAADDLSFAEILERLEVIAPDQAITLPPQAQSMPVHVGGPVEIGRGFVLHSTDYHSDDSTLPIDKGVGLTATLDVLRAIASGTGPRRAMLALGYAGWGPGQLEREIQSNGWLSCEADEELIFDPALDRKYEMALARLGVDPAMLSTEAGHA